MTREEVGQMLADRFLDETARADEVAAGFDDELDESVSFAFQMIRTARAFEHHLNMVTKDLTMTGLQARFAWLLASAPFGLPMTTLWVELGLSQPGVLTMVRRMERAGLVEIDASSWDPRNAVVGLTAFGRQQWATAKRRIREVCDDLDQGVGARDVPEFRDKLTCVEAVDERYPRFRSLRNPLGFLS